MWAWRSPAARTSTSSVFMNVLPVRGGASDATPSRRVAQRRRGARGRSLRGGWPASTRPHGDGQFRGRFQTPFPDTPANTYVGLTPSTSTSLFVKPPLKSVQLAPLSVERNTPTLVPANSVVPLAASAGISPLGSPLVTSVQF